MNPLRLWRWVYVLARLADRMAVATLVLWALLGILLLFVALFGAGVTW